MRRFSTSIRFVTALCYVLVLVFLISAGAVQAAVWHAIVGAQSSDKGKQALAFLPNEAWIHVGDSIALTNTTDEPHTVSFLIPGQTRPAFQVGCPPTPSGSSYTGAACVDSGVLANGQTYMVTFPTAGNFKFVCLVHVNMTGLVHVLNLSEILPHDQAYYDSEGQRDRTDLLSDASRLAGRGIEAAEAASGGDEGSRNEVTASISEIVGNGGGADSAVVMRFLQGTIVIHVGDTVEWTNLGPTTHTVTFGVEPANLVPPSAGVTVDSDGSRHATIGSTSASVNSGFLAPANQDRVGLAQSPPGVTRFRVTFTAPGTFNYICGLHDNLGMVGKVIVH